MGGIAVDLDGDGGCCVDGSGGGVSHGRVRVVVDGDVGDGVLAVEGVHGSLMRDSDCVTNVGEGGNRGQGTIWGSEHVRTPPKGFIPLEIRFDLPRRGLKGFVRSPIHSVPCPPAPAVPNAVYMQSATLRPSTLLLVLLDVRKHWLRLVRPPGCPCESTRRSPKKTRQQSVINTTKQDRDPRLPRHPDSVHAPAVHCGSCSALSAYLSNASRGW